MNDETKTVSCGNNDCEAYGETVIIPATNAAMCGVCGGWIIAPAEAPQLTNGGLHEPPLPGIN